MKPPRSRKISFSLKTIHERYDIGVEGKPGQVVMIWANAVGRKIVDEVWPEVEWCTSTPFLKAHPADWRFTHMRILDLPPSIEAVSTSTVEHTRPDALAFLVAVQLQHRATPKRVYHFTEEAEIAIYETDGPRPEPLQVEYIPPGTVVRA